MNQEEARAALAGATDAQMRLAAKMESCPPWRHAAFGLTMAVIVGSASLPLTLQMAGLAVGTLMVAAIFIWDRRRYGVFINGYRKGGTLPLTLVLLGVTMVLLISALHAREAGLSAPTKMAIAVAEFAFATATSVAWQRLYLRELRSGKL